MPTEYDVLDIILRLGIFGAFISISIFVFQTYWQGRSNKKESNERLRRVCNALCLDINNLGDWLKSEEYEALKIRHYAGGYSQNIFNTTPYQGIVNSGLITHLKDETQKKLNEYYFYAKLHNKRMYDLAQIFNNKASSSEYESLDDEQKLTSTVAWNLNEIELAKYEKRMQELIPELKLLLGDEIKRAK